MYVVRQVVGPSTKPIQPTHNGTWSSGRFRGLWKDQTWRGTPDDDELPLSDHRYRSCHSSHLISPHLISFQVGSADCAWRMAYTVSAEHITGGLQAEPKQEGQSPWSGSQKSEAAPPPNLKAFLSFRSANEAQISSFFVLQTAQA